MNLEHLQQIWDVQNNQPLYAVSEKALYDHIISKKRQASHISASSELIIILVNVLAGVSILWVNSLGSGGSVALYALAGWMLICGLYFIFSRIRRMRTDKVFDRSMAGDLRHAISTTSYQVQISQLMRWNALPIGALLMLGVWEIHKPLWVVGLIIGIFAVAYYATRWEHSIYVARKRELQTLKNRLESENDES